MHGESTSELNGLELDKSRNEPLRLTATPTKYSSTPNFPELLDNICFGLAKLVPILTINIHYCSNYISAVINDLDFVPLGIAYFFIF